MNSFKNLLLRQELSTRFQVLVTYRIKGHFGKVLFFQNACVCKHMHDKPDWKYTFQLSLVSFRMQSYIHSKESKFFLLFSRDPLTPLRKFSHPIRIQGDEKVSLTLHQCHMPLHWPINSKVVTFYTLKDTPKSTWGSQWGSGFQIVKFSTLQC